MRAAYVTHDRVLTRRDSGVGAMRQAVQQRKHRATPTCGRGFERHLDDGDDCARLRGALKHARYGARQA
jgi:hypothetical protein